MNSGTIGATRDNGERRYAIRAAPRDARESARESVDRGAFVRACVARRGIISQRRVGDGTASVRSRHEPARSGRPGSGDFP